MVLTTVQWITLLHLIFLHSLQSTARERGPSCCKRGRHREQGPNIAIEVLHHRANKQLPLVHIPRLLIPNPSEHFMDMLDFPPLRHGAPDRLGSKRPRSWGIHTRLVSRGFLHVQPSHLPLLRHCQHLHRILRDNVHGHTHILLGSQTVRRENLSYLFGGPLQSRWAVL